MNIFAIHRAFLICLLGIFWALPVAQSQIVITEIMYNPRTDGGDAEYIELYNQSDAPVDLSGWRFSAGVDLDMPQGLMAPAQGYVVVCRNEIFVRDFYRLDPSVVTVGNYAPSNLSNDGEEIELRDSLGALVDRVEYNDAPPWPVQADGAGSSLELVHPLADNSNAVYWTASILPTPGQANSQRLSNIPPRVLSVRAEPQSPSPSDAVTVSVQLNPDDTLTQATLAYVVNGGGQNSVNMSADGAVYSADIPAQADGARVEYWMTLVSEHGFGIRLPAGTVQERFVYRVMTELPEPGSIVINEIMYNNPDLLGQENEWIELFNPGSEAVDLTFWKLRDSNDDNTLVFPVGTSISAGGRLVIAELAEPGWPEPVIQGLPFTLGNNGDQVRLFDPNDNLIASVGYNDGAEWPSGADGDGGSLELIQASRPNDEHNNWAVSPNGGTPGRPNARAISDPAYADYDIVINEILYHPSVEPVTSDDPNLEFIELFNRGPRPVDLSGWRFSRGVDFSFREGSRLPAGEYMIVIADQAARAEYPGAQQAVGDFVLTLDNGGEAIALMNDDGVVIDYVDYLDDFPWPRRADGEGSSIELIAPFADNTRAQYWANGKPMSPGAPNHLIVNNPPPRVTDIRHTPERPVATESEDRFEIEPIIEEGDEWRFFRGTQAPPNDWNQLVFNDFDWESGPSGIGYGDGDDATVLEDMRESYVSVYARARFSLTDTDDIDQLTFRIDYDDSYIAYLNGVEVARSNVSGSPPAFDQTANGNHGASVDDGPGAIDVVDLSGRIDLLRAGRNVLAVQGHNVSITSSDFTMIPSLEIGRRITGGEDGADSIVIEAQVRDEDGVDSVTLHYQRLSAPPGAGLFIEDWRNASMLDDGSNGDRFAGDGRYAVRLSDLEEIKPNELWRYRISAVDGKGQAALARPLEDDAVSGNLIYVKDGNNQFTVPTVHLFMEQSALSVLARDPETNERQPGFIVIDGEPFDMTRDGGVRFRGPGEANNLKKNWKIFLPQGDRKQGHRVLNFNANNHTTPLLDGESGFLEHLAYQVFREVGVETPESRHYRMVLNEEPIGLYLQVQQPNDDFLDRHGLLAETEIYRAGVGSRRANMALEPDLETYRLKYENMVGREPDIETLVGFIESINQEIVGRELFERLIDIDAYIDYLCVVALTSHFDSVEKNYLPTRMADGRWTVLPIDALRTWGLTLTGLSFPLTADFDLLDGAETGRFFGTNVLRKRFLEVPEFRNRYFERLRYLTETIFTSDYLDPIIETYYAYLGSALSENKSIWDSPLDPGRMPTEVKAYIAARREFILNNGDVVPLSRSAKPVALSPINDASVSNRAATLRVQNPASGTILETQWQLALDGVGFAQPLWIGAGDSSNSIVVPSGIIASSQAYQWRMRWRVNSGGEDLPWSDWSDPASFATTDRLPPPDVQNVVVTNFDGSVRLEWDPLKAADLLRVDIFDIDGSIIESTPAYDNRVRIRDLANGQSHRFLIRTVAVDRQMSPGVLVETRPQGAPAPGQTIAWFRFEGGLADQANRFTDASLSGSASIQAPGGVNPIPADNTANTQALHLNGETGAAVQFGSTQAALDVASQLTIECFVRFDELAGRMVLVDRYDEGNADDDGIWRFGTGWSAPASLDFFFNDDDRNNGFNGRLHVSAPGAAVNDDAFHHYAVVVDLDESRISQRVKLFVDGRQVSAQIINDDGQSEYNRFRTETDLPVLIGARRAPVIGTADVLNGAIDEVRLTAGALSPEAFLNPPSPSVSEWFLY